MPLVWGKEVDFEYIVHLLGDELVKLIRKEPGGWCVNLLREVQPEDLIRVKEYGQFIIDIRIDLTALDHLCPDLMDLKNTSKLFPILRNITFKSSKTSAYGIPKPSQFSHLLTETLCSIRGENLLTDLLDDFLVTVEKRSASRLTHFSYSHDLGLPGGLNGVARLIQQCPELRSISLYATTKAFKWNVVEACMSRPHLKRLHLEGDPPPWPRSITKEQWALSLESFTFRSPLPSCVVAYLQHLDSNILVNLEVSCMAPAAHQPFLHVDRFTNLRSVTLKDFGTWGSDGVWGDCLPFLACHQMRSFRIYVRYQHGGAPYPVNDEALFQLAQAWPFLELLQIEPYDPNLTSLPTMRGLRSLARFCPELRFLIISVHASDGDGDAHHHPETLIHKSPSFPSTKLEGLQISGTIGNMSAEEVAVALSELWPMAVARVDTRLTRMDGVGS
ncbi:hypothetical protein FRB93_006714 [Tulasnella sp. JGI-2019a]|nr:hypothetical protein FRB93_006714 [Tulasnella sp. JGI-2019a]